MAKYILASASPRRREIFSRITDDFEVCPATGEERRDAHLSPEETAVMLAGNKCDEVYGKYRGTGHTVIGCDTVVALGDEILGKPRDREDAVNTLKKLSGKTHRVITGVTVRTDAERISDCSVSLVKMNALTDEFIEEYADGGSPMDKAGSYGIQDGGICESYSGSYTNIVGLPEELVREMLGSLRGEK